MHRRLFIRSRQSRGSLSAVCWLGDTDSSGSFVLGHFLVESGEHQGSRCMEGPAKAATPTIEETSLVLEGDGR